MGKSSRLFAVAGPVAAAIGVAAMIASCGESADTVITTTVTVHDTVTVVTRDTLHDTSVIANKESKLLLAGLVLAGIPADTADRRIDSCLVSLIGFGNPEPRELVAACNGHALGYLPDQKRDQFFGILNVDMGYLAHMVGAGYEGHFRDPASQFTVRVLNPYIPDTTKPPLFDTFTQSIGLPPAADTLRFSHDNGIRYDSISYFALYAMQGKGYRISLTRDLEVSWKGGAAWYAVECTKYFETMYDYVPVGEILDTFVTAPSMALPKSYLYQDTAYDSTKSYHFLHVSVVPVNGPAPSAWKNYSSFGGNGHLFAMRAGFSSAAVNAFPFDRTRGGLTKGMPGAAFRRPSADAVVRRVLARYAIY